MAKDKKNRQTALITGASSGIGYELTKHFAKEGCNLVLVARNKQTLDKIAEDLEDEFGISASVIPSDLSSPISPDEIIAELMKMSIQVDILVNNAGFNEYGPFHKTDLQKELQMIQVNLVSLTHLTKLFLPGMLEQGFGKILNVGSTGSFVPGPLNAVYCATKAYVLSFSEAIAEELKGTGVTVTVLCPGSTDTNFAKKADIENVLIFKSKLLLMDAETVAKIGYNALMKNKRVSIAGFLNKIQIFSVRFTPRSIVAKLSKYFMSR